MEVAPLTATLSDLLVTLLLPTPVTLTCWLEALVPAGGSLRQERQQ